MHHVPEFFLLFQTMSQENTFSPFDEEAKLYSENCVMHKSNPALHR